MKKTMIAGLAAGALLLTGCGGGGSSTSAGSAGEAEAACRSILDGHLVDYTNVQVGEFETEPAGDGRYQVYGEYSANLPSGTLNTQGFLCEATISDSGPAARVDRWGASKDAVRNPELTPAPRSGASTTAAAATTTATLRRGELLPEDRAFLASLNSYWTDSAPNADLIEVGTAICEKLNSGADKTAILKAAIPDSGPADNGINLMHSAIVAYCPEHLTGIK